MEWISVKDKLPEIDSIDLICANEELGSESFICNYGKITLYSPYSHEICFSQPELEYGEYMRDRKIDVTHWMPLPELPKQELI